jgi:hypothetical protein
MSGGHAASQRYSRAYPLFEVAGTGYHPAATISRDAPFGKA